MANVTVGINSKFDSKGVEDSKKSLDGLKKTLTSIGTMAKNMFNFAVLDKARSAFQSLSTGAVEVYKSNQIAYQKLASSINTNNKLIATSFNDITKFTSELSSNSMFGSDVLNEQAAVLAGLGTTTDEMRNLMQAAIDLSAVGIGELEGNCKDLAETLTGEVSGELRKLVPEFRGLTEEQLKAGKAIEIINQKYKDYAKTIKENTLEGKENRFQSAIDTMRGSIGLISGNVKSVLLDEINPVLESIGSWVSENAPKIGAAIISYVKVVRDIVKNIKDNFNELQKPETWSPFFSHANSLTVSFINYLSGALKDTFTNAVEVLKWA
jgi:hypothetical protein